MKIVYLNPDNTVREIISPYALPVERFYGQAFAARCVTAPDDVAQRWRYDPDTQSFVPPEVRLDAEVPPTETELLRADLDFVAAMLGVEL